MDTKNDGLENVSTFKHGDFGDLSFQENYNTPLEHTPVNPPGQLWKESHYSLFVKV